MTPLRQEFARFQAPLRREGKASRMDKGKAEALPVVLGARGVLLNAIVRQ